MPLLRIVESVRTNCVDGPLGKRTSSALPFRRRAGGSRVGECCRDDVLGDRVHAIRGGIAGACLPGRREALLGSPAHQGAVARQEQWGPSEISLPLQRPKACECAGGARPRTRRTGFAYVWRGAAKESSPEAPRRAVGAVTIGRARGLRSRTRRRRSLLARGRGGRASAGSVRRVSSSWRR